MRTTKSHLLHARVAELRRVARAIESTPAIELVRHPHEDTWRGARPTFCVSTLTRHRDRLLAAVHDLRAEARRLEAEAHQIDAMQTAALQFDAPEAR